MPLGGHLQAKEKGEDPKPPGGRQWKLNLVRWVCHGERHRQLRKTRPDGKETLLRPYAPLGAIRTNIYIYRERERNLHYQRSTGGVKRFHDYNTAEGLPHERNSEPRGVFVKQNNG